MHAHVKCEMMITEYPNHQLYFPYNMPKIWLADILTRTPILTNTRISNILSDYDGSKVDKFLDKMTLIIPY